MFNLNKKAFTLIEVVVVVIVLGVLATLALPRLSGYVTRMESEEAKQILRATYMSYKTYLLKNNDTPPGSFADLDADVDVAALKHFDPPQILSETLTDVVSGTNYPTIAVMNEENGVYAIRITSGGTLVCENLSSPTACNTIGLPIAQ